tara:strand:+ start:189 stop:491 length:303 start_codon:yes stop_codon:yes gene_type:complete
MSALKKEAKRKGRTGRAAAPVAEPLEADGALKAVAAARHAVAARPPPTLPVPPDFTNDNRRSYLDIARRAQAHQVHGYTVMALGLQTFLRLREVAARAAE